MTNQSNVDIDVTLEEKEKEALEIFRELAPECDEEMVPSCVKYQEDGKKATFYFLCEHRVDFRELVKQLNSRLAIQVEMRQIGQREQACMVGGLGPCGHELCCCRLGGECCHQNATIKMAKNQNLSLNPTKISGMCGRLMCCLRFENEFYKDFKDRAPKINSFVDTPDGPAKVVAHDPLFERLTLRHEDDKPRKILLSDLDCTDEESKQFSCGIGVWDAADPSFIDLSSSAANVTINTSIFTENDHMTQARGAKLADKKETESTKTEKHRSRRHRRSRGSRGSSSAENTQARQSSANRPGRNSSGTATRPGGNSSGTATRPGGNSSGVRSSQKATIRVASAPIERKAKTERKPRLRRTTKINSGKEE